MFKNALVEGFIMNTKDLNYFHELVKQKNFSKVADYFHVSQPTISQAIKRLEDEFNTKLFDRDRSHGQLHVTVTGKQLDRHVLSILNELDVAQADIARVHQNRIRFGLPPIIGNYLVPNFAPQLMNADILSLLDVVEYGSAQLLKMLRKGEIDMALLGSLTPLKELGIRTVQIGNYPLVIAASPENRQLRAIHDPIHFAQLRHERFIGFNKEFVHYTAFNELCRQTRIRPKVIYRGADIQIIKRLVQSNLGIAYLSTAAITDQDRLLQIPLLDVQQSLHCYCAVRESTILRPSEQKLWDIFAQDSSTNSAH